jgi:hypothetical protein
MTSDAEKPALDSGLRRNDVPLVSGLRRNDEHERPRGNDVPQAHRGYWAKPRSEPLHCAEPDNQGKETTC